MTTSTDVIDLPALICRYSDRFHGGGGITHQVASPLGAWLLLAMSGRSASGRLCEELTTILGADPEAAARLAHRLLEAPHPAIACAAAVWARKGRDAEALRPFLASLPAVVEQGVGIPTASELDAWAREHTLGLIKRFPLRPGSHASIVLANALATKVRWAQPFEIAPATRLGARSRWSGMLQRVLLAYGGEHHTAFIARTAGAGDVAVHSTWSCDDLQVTSVVASPEIPAREVMAAAHDIAIQLPTGDSNRLSLYDLPLGETATWNIVEREMVSSAPVERAESYSALIPAWEAQSDHDLLGRELGFEFSAEALAQIAGLPLLDVEAKQSALARYTRFGFEAAAVTAMSVALGRLHRELSICRHAELRFGHPFAVVAVATDHRQKGDATPGARSPWHGVPVFSAWVEDPMDTKAEPDDFLELEPAPLGQPATTSFVWGGGKPRPTIAARRWWRFWK